MFLTEHLIADAVESSSEGKTGLYGPEYKLYNELWFIILMAFLGLLLLALLMGLVLRRALSKPPFIRERPPIAPLQRRSTKYPPNDTYMVRENCFLIGNSLGL